MKYLVCNVFLWSALSCGIGLAYADALPKWELGIGVATLNLPDYRGADQRSTYFLPMPYLIYRGDLIRADREGIRGMLVDSKRLKVNISLNGTLPVSASNNDIRRGMADLDPTVEIGPTLDLSLWQSADELSKVDLRLPLRGSVTLSTSPQHIGWLLFPHVSYRVHHPFGLNGWNAAITAGSYFTDKQYNSYFYSVAPEYVTAWRPAYQASGGYAGSQLTWTLSRRFPDYWIGAFVRYDNLRDAAFEDSPLVKQRAAFSAGIALSWILHTSAQKVESQE